MEGKNGSRPQEHVSVFLLPALALLAARSFFVCFVFSYSRRTLGKERDFSQPNGAKILFSFLSGAVLQYRAVYRSIHHQHAIKCSAII